MFTVLLLRTGEQHIVSYQLSNGNFRTLCSKTFNKNLHMNTIAADNTYNGLCANCKAYHDEMYESDLNYDPRMARNEVQYKYPDQVFFNREDLQGAKAKYEDSLSLRLWGKLNKYKRLLSKPKKNKSKKFKFK